MSARAQAESWRGVDTLVDEPLPPAPLPRTRWGIAGWRSDGWGVVERSHVAAVALAVDLEADLIDRVRATVRA